MKCLHTYTITYPLKLYLHTAIHSTSSMSLFTNTLMSIMSSQQPSLSSAITAQPSLSTNTIILSTTPSTMTTRSLLTGAVFLHSSRSTWLSSMHGNQTIPRSLSIKTTILKSTLSTPPSPQTAIRSAVIMQVFQSYHSRVNETIRISVSSSSSIESTMSHFIISKASDSPATPDQSGTQKLPRSLCNNYRTLVDEERRSSRLKLYDTKNNSRCDLKYESAVRFVSKDDGINLQLKEGCKLVDQFTRTCSSLNTNVWLPEGSHPQSSGTAHALQVCIKSSGASKFFDENYCQCERKQILLVELCENAEDRVGAGFYVYRLFPLFKSTGNTDDAKDCLLNYCTNLQKDLRRV